MANTVYIFNCGINPITSLIVNTLPATLPTGGLPAWTSGVAASPSAITPATCGIYAKGSGTPSTAALVAGNTNSISISSNLIDYNGANVIDLTSFSLTNPNDNFAMFIFFGTGATFNQPGNPAATMAQVVLTDTFGEFAQAFLISGGVLRK
jgi:hypothetical protein